MNRKEYMESFDAKCANHQFSWSFVNVQHKIVYFGWWQHETSDDGAERIFSLDWEFNGKGHRSKGFKQSCHHIDLVLFEQYKLRTFTQIAKDITSATISIKEIIPLVRDRKLVVSGNDYYAYPESYNFSPSNVVEPKYTEGAKKLVIQTLRERNPEARKKCLDVYGFSCRVCDFDFEKIYGLIGQSYIHVHHLELIAKKDGVHSVDPVKDLRPVCPNCHAMIHKRVIPIGINEMRRICGKPELDNP